MPWMYFKQQYLWSQEIGIIIKKVDYKYFLCLNTVHTYTTGKIMNEKTRKESLANALKQIDKDFEKNTVMKLGTKEVLEVPSISTGSFSLDKALGIGGLPKGRVVEIYGPNHQVKLH